MSAEFQFIMEVWESVRDVIPANKKADAAIGIMNAFENYGTNRKALLDVIDEDPDLANAYHEVYPEDEEEEEELDYDDGDE